MGLTYARVKVCNLADPSKFVEKELLVDTGAVYTMVSRSALEEIDIRPFRRRRFRAANGQEFEREVGGAIFEYEGIVSPGVVIFGEEGDEEVLGVQTLEGFGLELDVVTGQLRPMRLLMVFTGLEQCAVHPPRPVQPEDWPAFLLGGLGRMQSAKPKKGGR